MSNDDTSVSAAPDKVTATQQVAATQKPAATVPAAPATPVASSQPNATPQAAVAQKPATAIPAAPKTPVASSQPSATPPAAATQKPAAAVPAAPVTPATPSQPVATPPTTAPQGSERHILQSLPDLDLRAISAVATFNKIYARISFGMKILLSAVLLPTLLSLLYFGLWASPMYIAEAYFAVRGAEGNSTGSGLMTMLLPSATTVGVDANIVAAYIQSPDIMDAIDGEMHIFEHFSSREYDIISRLAADATRDERLTYWQWVVTPSFDQETGIIALSVRAYDPVMAKKLAEAVLAKSEALVNAMSRRAQNDAISLAMSEVKTAEVRVRKAQDAMRAFRERSGILDPVSTAGSLQGIVSQLESDVVRTRAEIAEASTYMSKNAPALVGLRARLEAVEKQLASEKQRLAGEAARPDSLTSFAGEYEALHTENEFARQQLVSAMASLEAARVKANAKSRYVEAFQIPVLPDEALYPRPFLFTAYVLIGSLVLVGLCSLIIAAVREHAGF